MPQLAVVHSPTPSSVRMAASSKGLGWNALAAWDSWCVVKKSGPVYAPPSPASISRGRCSFFCSHCGMLRTNDPNPRGAKASEVSRMRSNFRSGFS